MRFCDLQEGQFFMFKGSGCLRKKISKKSQINLYTGFKNDISADVEVIVISFEPKKLIKELLKTLKF